MSSYRIRLRVSPHSTGSGSDADAEACGGRHHTFNIVAEDFAAACRAGDLLSAGICVNPRVWQANIVAVELVTA